LVITSESSELEVFAKTRLGYNACNNNNLLVSLLEPVIDIVALRVEIAECSCKFMALNMSCELIIDR
jgi:hypothetical protein